MTAAARALDAALKVELSLLKAGIAQGQGPEGSLGQYSASYKKFRKKWGRNTSPIDLTMSGQLRDAMLQRDAEIKGAKIEGAIYFNQARGATAYAPKSKIKDNISLARALIDSGKKFFGLSKEAKQRLIKAVNKAIGKK